MDEIERRWGLSRMPVMVGCPEDKSDSTFGPTDVIPLLSEERSDRCFGLEGTELRRDKLEAVPGRTAL
jgi:hypothetical protein